MGRRAGVTSDETRHELLAATMKLLLERGYEGTRVSEIAREAGLTTGAIYNHFASKADLLTAAIAEQGPGVISDLVRSGRNSSVLEVFRLIGVALPDRAEVMGPLLLELIVSSTRDRGVPDVVSGQFGDKERETADIIRIAQTNGEVASSLDAEALARFTTMLALGALVAATLELKPVDNHAWAAVIDRVLDAMQPAQEQP